MEDVRSVIHAWLAENPQRSLKEVSLRVGKNETYLQQYLRYNKPAKLPEEVRVKLAEIMGVDEVALGAPSRERSAPTKAKQPADGAVVIPEHDVRASAGGGALVAQENEVAQWPFPYGYVRHVLSISTSNLSIIEVIGDSMEPTLKTGDKVLVDLDDRAISTPGIFVLHDGDGTVIKRVERIPASDPPMVALISDNQLHGRYQVPADFVNVVGRVVWFGRRL